MTGPRCRYCGEVAQWIAFGDAGLRLGNLVAIPGRTYWLEPSATPRSKGGPPPLAHKLHPRLEAAAAADAGLTLTTPHRNVCASPAGRRRA